MKNLKRALSFALASVMVIGMMVVGAGAANFTDADEIVNEEAVNILVTLGVIAGKEDGSYFDPTGIVTRAEMAKMITVALNGGKDPVLGTSNTPTYTDIKGTWAESYIEYCSNLGIIAGRGDGTFDPTGTVTGTEAAKMILVAIGYEAETEGFVGSNWAIATNTKASAKDLYKDLETIDPSEGMTRDNAAQMIWNGIQAKMIKYDFKLVTNNGELNTVAVAEDDTKSILSSKFGMGTADAVVTGISYNEDKAEYTYALKTAMGGTTVVNYTTEADYTDLFALPVKVLYKGTLTSKNTYGIYTDAVKIAEGIIGKVTLTEVNNAVDGNAEKVKFDNVEYKLTQTVATTEVYAYNTAWVGNMSEIAAANKYDTFAAYDITDDGEADMIVWYPTTVAQVTFAGKENITIGAPISDSLKYDENDIDETIESDDYVVVTIPENTVTGDYIVAKAEVVTGKVDAVKGTKVQVNGTWYEKNGKTVDLDKTYDLVVVNGYICNVADASESSKDLLVVSKVGSYDSFAETTKVQVIFADGTSEVIAADGNVANSLIVGKLYTYEIDDGVYELTDVSSDNKAGYDNGYWTSGLKFVESTGKMSTGARIADDAVVFITYDTDTVKVITGAELKDMSNDVGGLSGSMLTDTVNGYETAKVIALRDNATDLPGLSGDETYGYVVSDITYSKDGDDTYASYDIWTGSEIVSVKEKTSATEAAEDAFVKYDDLGDGLVDNVTALTMVDGAVVAYSGEDIQIKVNATTTKDLTVDDEDTVVLYVDYEETKGVEGGSITLADKASTTTYTPNVKYIDSDNDDVIELLVVDITNETGAGAI